MSVSLPPFNTATIAGQFAIDIKVGFQDVIAFLDQQTEELVKVDTVLSGPPFTHAIFGNRLYDKITIDYGAFQVPVLIDLSTNPQHGGAEGTRLTDVFSILGTPFNDVIRGSDLLSIPDVPFIFNNPGVNVLRGGGGDDIIEGRGGGDVIDGNSGSDTASYESSPSGVFVTVNEPDPALGGQFIAAGGDATGDTLISIENLAGSASDDVLTGASNDNILAGGLGNDILNGKGGTDTADYSRDRFIDQGRTADFVVVTLIDGAGASMAVESAGSTQYTDALISIENVTGTDGGDTMTGNSLANVFDGRGGDDVLDGGLGNDTMIGGSGKDTATYASHNSLGTVETGIIALGRGGILNPVDGSATYRNGAQQVVETDVLRGIENVTGSKFNETISGNEQDNILNGGGGTDTVSFAEHDSTSAFLNETNTIRLSALPFLSGGDGSYVRQGVVFNSQTRQFQAIAETDVLRNFQNAIGSNRSETIIGSTENNVLDGRGGNDTMDGGLGNDTMIGGGGSNTASFQSLSALVGSRPPITGAIALGVNGGDGFATFALTDFGRGVEIDVLRQIDNVLGSSHTEIISGNEHNNVLDGGGGGIDTVSFVDHDSISAFINESNVIILGTHVDEFGLNGTDGTYLRQGVTINPVTGQPVPAIEADVLRNFQNVVGSNRSETIIGNDQANTIDGRGGSDLIDGGIGNDTMVGGAGINTVSFASHNSLTAVLTGSIALGLSGADGTATYTGSIGTETDVLRQFDNVIGSKFNETITGNEKDNVLDGGGGNDLLIGNGGRDTASFVSLDAFAGVAVAVNLGLNGADGRAAATDNAIGIDTLRGSIFNIIGTKLGDGLVGNEQDNTINGRGSHDVMQGGGGNDTYDYRGATDSQGSDDIVDTSGGADRLLVDSLADFIRADQSGANLIVTLRTGTATIINHFKGQPVESVVDPQGNSLTLATGTTGGNGNGIIVGGNGGQTLDGRGGDDFLFGGNGTDRLIGGDGNDHLTGDNGPDTFVFGPGFGHDVITDLGPADTIEFDGDTFFSFKEVRAAARQVGDDTVITLDADNSITLEDVALHSLHAGDFVFG